MEFSGKELIQGEPDASSFPSGGLRATFEAQGLHRLGPHLLRLHQGRHACASPPPSAPTAARRWTRRPRCCARWRRINRQALRILRLFGNDDGHAVSSPRSGPEQEYFLDRPRAVRPAPGPDLHRPHAVRRHAPQGAGAGRPLLRRHQAPRRRVHEGTGRGAVEAGHPRQDRAQRGRARPARAGARSSPPPTSPPTTTS